MRAVERRDVGRAAGASGSPSRSPTSAHVLAARRLGLLLLALALLLGRRPRLRLSPVGVRVGSRVAGVAARRRTSRARSARRHRRSPRRARASTANSKAASVAGRTIMSEPPPGPGFPAIMTDRCSGMTPVVLVLARRRSPAAAADGDTVPVVVSAPVSRPSRGSRRSIEQRREARGRRDQRRRRRRSSGRQAQHAQARRARQRLLARHRAGQRARGGRAATPPCC